MPNIIPDFFLCANPSTLPNTGLILFTQYPFFIGKIVLFDKKNETYHQFIDKLNNSEFAVFGKVPRYRIVIVYYNSLEKMDLLDCKADALIVFRNMAAFYLKDKIASNESYFRKYLES